jgi:tetratricopeptide (TPR) repeat protein
MGVRVRFSYLLLLLLISLFAVRASFGAQKELPTADALARQEAHQDPQWQTIQAHLPDPMTASAAKLETAADVLRARRFPEDALDYYQYALRRGGYEPQILNKMGVIELELRQPVRARAYFQRVVKVDKKNPEGWNNLGAIEYMTGRYGNAISNYHKAIKLDGSSASFHSNLATAYFEKKDFENARKEYDIALKLDPQMLERRGTSGITTRMLSPADHARFCFELARLYAQRGDEAQMLHFLTMASEAGFNVLGQMGGDTVLARYKKDARVLLLVKNAEALRNGKTGITQAAGAAPPPPLPAPVHE